MAQDTGVNLPAGFGGLVNYKEGYDTRFPLKPTYVIGFVVLIIALRIGLNYLF